MSFLNRLSFLVKIGKKKTDQTNKKTSSFFPKKIVVSEKSLELAQAKARELILEAKDKAFEIKREADLRAREIQKDAVELKETLDKKEADIDRRTGATEERENLLRNRESELGKRLSELDKIKRQQIERLEKAANLTREEAKKLILEATENKLQGEIAHKIREADEKAKEEADEKAKDILIDAMKHGATDYVPEYTVSTVKLPDEEMKGRIIGKEGRNIRTFEKVTGVDVDLDEEGIIRLSSFDSVRREIARVALETLIADGRIQPSRIEEVVNKAKQDVEKIMYKSGEDLCHRIKVYNLPREIIEMLGRFKYRFSYGQNMIAHTLEETKIGVKLAYEVGANVNITRLGCLLHDIGKVITEEEGTHVQVAIDFLRKYNIPEEVIACVAEHHQDKPFSSKEAVLVYISDAISGSRPGARYEDYEEYVTRLKKIEDAAKSFKGVQNAFAIQAGREVRVVVNPEKVDDAATIKLAHDLREKLEKELTYPGQIKVSVVRELRVNEVAK